MWNFWKTYFKSLVKQAESYHAISKFLYVLLIDIVFCLLVSLFLATARSQVVLNSSGKYSSSYRILFTIC